MIDLSISLLSFNNKDLLKNCLNSIYKNTKKIKFEILLVDNASEDGSVAMVKKNFPQVKIISNRQNKLYIKGHNQNLSRVNGRYFLILNEDTSLPTQTLDKMVSFMDKNPKIGLASCRQKDEKGNVDNTCSRFPHPFFEILELSYIQKMLKLANIRIFENMLGSYRYYGWKRDTIRQVDVIPGSLIIGRSELLKRVGLLDQDSFLFFYGEPDYCKRVKKEGFLIFHNGKITIKHLKSKGLNHLSATRRYQFSEHDVLAYHKKYFGKIWYALLWLFLRPNWLSLKLKKP